ncbi:hemerythrin domain-containing protein [Sphingomonas mesophila]|uniref:hemerythrin domain-containing protein n=1 Tax=Sphingomonas mesophila TaxID=2303576 RepID=UPI000E570B91|nr:hemerythrin domain-containing protein [Sphingomonas mesophila]
MANDIFERLKKDHDQHRALLADLFAAEGKPEQRQRLFERFKIEVTAHAAAEEETLYATMLAREELRHDAVHSVAEHKEIGDLLKEIAEADVRADDWRASFQKLADRYIHHIDEEEQDMFPAAAEGLSDDKVRELRARFEQRKPAEIERALEGADEGDERD